MAERFAFSLLTLLVVGCGGPSTAPPTASPSSNAPSPPPPPSAAVNVKSTLDEALSSFEQGNVDQAMATFMDIDWSAPGAISDNSPLATTEDDFKAAGVSGDAELTNTVTNEIQNLRGLADHITTAAKAEKDPAVARPMLKQLEACCVYLLTNERAQFIQLVGEALQTTTQKQLEQLPSEQ